MIFTCIHSHTIAYHHFLVLAAWISGYDVGLWLADFPRSMPDLWLTCDHLMGNMSVLVSQPGQLSLSSLRGRQMSSNPCNYQGCVWLVCSGQSMGAGLAYGL